MGVLGAIPSEFTQQTSSADSFFIQKGQLNRFMLRPKIVNEHAEASRDAVATVQAGNSVGQVFIASQDNINGIEVTLESAAGQVLDNFESYADDAALQAAWVASNASYLAELETTVVPPTGATQSMKLDGSANIGDEWATTITATDYTGFTSRVSVNQDFAYGSLKMRFFIGDGVNTKSQALVVQNVSQWNDIFIDVGSMTEDGGVTDVANITQVGFRLEDNRQNSSVYVDTIVFAPEAGSVLLELWDLGTKEPISGVTALDDGTQYESFGDIGISGGVVSSNVTLKLSGGLRRYNVRGFIAGVAFEEEDNVPLNIGHFYAITIKYIDTDVTVYGAIDNSFSNPIRGGAFTYVDNATPAVEVGEFTDVQFAVFSTQDCYINTLVKAYNAEPADRATEVTYVEGQDKTLEGIIAGERKPLQQVFIEFRDKTFFLPKGGLFITDYNDDFEDSVTQVNILIGYIFEPQLTFSKGELG